MKLNQKGIDLMHKFEGLRLTSYLCPANKWTIGYGNTFYEDGKKVQPNQTITKSRAEQLFKNVVNNNFSQPIRNLLKVQLNENQFLALVCFAYNVGVANLGRSTLLKKVNVNPNDPTIAREFLKWNKAGGKILNGLTRRRIAEKKFIF